MSYEVKWIGQGGFILSDGSCTLAIDPYLSDLVEKLDGLKRLVPPAEDMKTFRPNAVFFTHEHIDHLDRIAMKAMPKEGVRYLCPPVCKPFLLDAGVKEEQIELLSIGDEADIGSFHIKTVFAEHTEGSLGALITCGGITVYFTGDSLWSERLGDGLKADVIECCINGRWGNMDHNEAAKLTEKVGAKLAIPNHYGMFAENTADPENFKKAIADKPVAYYEMTYNQWFDVSAMLK